MLLTAISVVVLAQMDNAMYLLPSSGTISPLLEDTESPGTPSSEAATPYPRSLLIEDEDVYSQTDSPLLSDLDKETQLLIRRDGWKRPAPSMDLDVYRAISNNLMGENTAPHQRPHTEGKPCHSIPEVIDLSAKSEEGSTTVITTKKEPEIVISRPLHPRHGYKKKKETTNIKPNIEIQSDQAFSRSSSKKAVKENINTTEEQDQQSNDTRNNDNNIEENDSGKEINPEINKEDDHNDIDENYLGKEVNREDQNGKKKDDLPKGFRELIKENDNNDTAKNDLGKEGKGIDEIDIDNDEEDDDYNDVDLSRSMRGPFVYILELLGSFLQLILGAFGSLSSGSRNYPTIGTRGIGK